MLLEALSNLFQVEQSFGHIYVHILQHEVTKIDMHILNDYTAFLDV